MKWFIRVGLPLLLILFFMFAYFVGVAVGELSQ